MFLCVFVVCFCLFIWNSLLSDIFPWSKTDFSDYEEYKELIYEQNVIAHFPDELPEDASNAKYYYRRNFKEKYAAYSFVLPKEELKQYAEERMASYYDFYKDFSDAIFYCHQEDAIYSFKALKRECEGLDFVDYIMQESQEQQGYYCLIVIRTGTYHGICHRGVLMNDTTCEVIEFSVEIPGEIE